MATKRQRRKRRRRAGATAGAPGGGASQGAGAGAAREALPPNQRASEATASERAAPRAGPPRPQPGDGPPQAPWGNFPLSEIVVAIALVLLIAGFVVPPPRGAVMLGAGLVLGSLAGLELSVREHFAGYKSHTMLLAGAAGIGVLGALFVVGPEGLAPVAKVAAALVAFGLAAWRLTRAFRRRSGGALFKTKA
jgi:hypothetical protein